MYLDNEQCSMQKLADDIREIDPHSKVNRQHIFNWKKETNVPTYYKLVYWTLRSAMREDDLSNLFIDLIRYHYPERNW